MALGDLWETLWLKMGSLFCFINILLYFINGLPILMETSES